MSFTSLFTEQPKKHWVSGLGAEGGSWRIKPTSFNEDDDDSRFPEFQKAWRNGTSFNEMFGRNPFTLQGSVGRTGVDNHRPDVAKIESFLTGAGYYKPLTKDGPSGYHNDDLGRGIKRFQKDNGLKVDGMLLPDGPTIKTLSSKLGQQAGVVKLTSAQTGTQSDAEPIEQVAVAPAFPWLLGGGLLAGGVMSQQQSQENRAPNPIAGAGSAAPVELSNQEMLARILKPHLYVADVMAGGKLLPQIPPEAAKSPQQIPPSGLPENRPNLPGKPDEEKPRTALEHPMLEDALRKALPLENSLGTPLTRKGNDIVIQECLKVIKEEFPELDGKVDHVGGGTEKGAGINKKKEEYMRGAGPRNWGSNRPDITFKLKDFLGHLRINTADTRRGEITEREQTALDKIQKKAPGQMVEWIPKLTPGMDEDEYRKMANDKCRQWMSELERKFKTEGFRSSEAEVQVD